MVTCEGSLKILYKLSIIGIAVAITVVAAYLFIRHIQVAPLAELGDMKVGEGEVGMLFLGDSAFILRTSNHTIIIDPAAKITPDMLGSLGRIDAILITHEHSDHFDADATFNLHHASEAVVVANEGAYQSLQGLIHRAEKLVLLRSGEVTKIDGIVVQAIASNHSAISPLMYVISMDNITILHGSDSGFEPALEDYRGKIDIALLPTGGASPTASPSQAFKMAEAVHPKVVIPMHGTSSQNDELGAFLASLSDVNFVKVQAMSPQKITVP